MWNIYLGFRVFEGVLTCIGAVVVIALGYGAYRLWKWLGE